jgi:hypothetical protein
VAELVEAIFVNDVAPLGLWFLPTFNSIARCAMLMMSPRWGFHSKFDIQYSKFFFFFSPLTSISFCIARCAMLMMSPRWGFRSKFDIQNSKFFFFFSPLNSHLSTLNSQLSTLTSQLSTLNSHLSTLNSIFIPASSTSNATRNPGIKDALASKCAGAAMPQTKNPRFTTNPDKIL